MIAENTRELLAPVNQWLPAVWTFLITILVIYVLYSIAVCVNHWISRKFKKEPKSRDCSFRWLTYEEVMSVAHDLKKKQTSGSGVKRTGSHK